jgi:ribonuclease P protein component
MARDLDQAFPKEKRLLRRAEFLEVQKLGQRVDTRAYIGVFLTGTGRAPRLGITTSKRLGPAVARNRARRVVREAFRRRRLELPQGVDLVVIPKHQALELETKLLIEDLARLGERVRNSVERAC